MPKSLALAGLALLMFIPLARADDTITIPATTQPAIMGQLKMGGKNPAGDELNVTNQSLTLNGKPIYPVMGEMHYSRYPQADWERELLKMKAGGITVVSTYIIWIHHEEVEDQWDWSGNKNLREFVQTCGKLGLWVWIRPGPWDHSEARNGGIPDWVIAKTQRQRTTRDQQFMIDTKQLYSQVYEQCEGLLYKDGGPVIGFQTDNEVRNDPDYLLALKNMAKEIGFDVPFYSMTGWGPARVPPMELLPMFGGYADGFWIAGNTVAPASRIQFFFTHNPSDEGTRMTNPPVATLPTNLQYLLNYPYLTCECGGGMAISYARRPIMEWKDETAEALCKIGDGSNLMGYYMYHGGQDPMGKLTSLQESQTTKITNDNDMPEYEYDFQAPLGQYGQVREHYHSLGILHKFLADFGADLTSMPSIMPDNLPKNLDDTQTTRWAVRSDGKRGYIFINNYERGFPMAPRKVQFTLKMADGEMQVPASPVQIPADSFMFWPFNFDMNGVKLLYTTAQPVCRLEDGANPPIYCFFAVDGVDPQFAFDPKNLASAAGPGVHIGYQHGQMTLNGFFPGVNCMMTLTAPSGKQARLLLLTQDEAMHLYKAKVWGADRLLVSPANLSWDDKGLIIDSNDPMEMHVSVCPVKDEIFSVGGKDLRSMDEGDFQHFIIRTPEKTLKLNVQQIAQAGPAPEIIKGARGKPLPPDDAVYDKAAVYHIAIPSDALDGVRETIVRINYSGDVARAYIGDQFVEDDYNDGLPWDIGLSRFGKDVLDKGLTIKIIPLRKDTTISMKLPDFGGKDEVATLNEATAVFEYELRLDARGK